MKMTKIALALAAIGMSAVAFAGAPGNQVVAPAGVNLIAPDSVGVWSIGLEALYVEPTNNEFTYGQNVGVNGNQVAYAYKNKSVNNDWEWGGTVDLTYMFPGNSRDVKLAWTHLFSNTETNHTTPGSGQYFQPAFGEGNFGPGLNSSSTLAGITSSTNSSGSAKGSARTDYNAVDLVFGQWIKIGDRLDLHPFGGLRWADVDSSFKGKYYPTNGASVSGAGDYANTTSTSSIYDKISSDFDGIGPRAGFDTAVHLGSGFSIVGTFAGSLLVGDIDSKFSNTTYNTTTSSSHLLGVTSSSGAVTTTGYRVKNNNNNTSVVPELDARLGLDYMYAFTPATSMNIQLGYQVVNYFNVTEADFVSAGASQQGGLVNTTSNREDWGYQGPYLRLQLNIA